MHYKQFSSDEWQPTDVGVHLFSEVSYIYVFILHAVSISSVCNN